MFCLRCSEQMEEKKVDITYLNNTSQFNLTCCPKCGQVYVPESMQRKMIPIEQVLEGHFIEANIENSFYNIFYDTSGKKTILGKKG